MKKKFLSVILAMAMVLSLMPVAFAEGEDNNTTATSLPEADASGVITLTQDVTATLTVNQNDNITLDLNGHTLTNTAGNDTISNYGTLTIVDNSENGGGTVDNVTHAKGALVNYVGGVVTIKSGTLKRSAEASNNSWYTIKNLGTMEINGGTVTLGDTNNNFSSLISNGWYSGSSTSGVTNDRNVAHQSGQVATLTINGGTFSGGKYTVKNDDYGNMTITEGTFNAFTEACVLNWNVAEIAGGTFTGTGANEVIYNGAGGDGDAGELTITGGQFTSGANRPVITGANNLGTIEIENGTFTAGENGNIITVPSGGTSDISITGGTFSSDVSNYFPEGVALTQDESGKVVADTTNAVASINNVKFTSVQAAINAAINAASVGDTVTLLKNVELSAGVQVINKNIILDLGGHTLSRNGNVALWTVYSTVVIQNGTIALTGTSSVLCIGADRGSKLTIASDATIIGPYGIAIGKYFNFTDSSLTENTSGSGTTIDIYGTVKGSNDTNILSTTGTVGLYINGNVKSTEDYPTIHLYSGSNVSGEHGSSGNTNTDDGPAIYAAGYGEWIIDEGATLSGDEALSIKSGKFTINGGTFNASGEYVDPATSWGNGTEATGAAISITNNNGYAKNVELTINDGTFTSEKGYALYESDTQAQPGDAVTSLVIEKGTFVGADDGAIYSKNEKGFVNGGNYSDSVNPDYLDEKLNAELVKSSGDAPYSYYTSVTAALEDAQPGDTITNLNTDPDSGEMNEPVTVVTVTFNIGSVTTKQNILAGGNVTLERLDDYGYNYFRGWTDGAGNFYPGGSTVTINADTTFTAQWTYIPPANPNPSYSVNVPSVSNGKVSVTPSSAGKNATVTITATPDKDYELASLTVVDANGNRVPVTQVGENKFTFTMPGSAVSVQAEFRRIPDAWTNPYTDVAESAWYYDAVKYAAEHGLMGGNGDGTFAPTDPTNRSMIATILYRLEGQPAVSGGSDFSDVADGAWYADAVAWAVANNIMGGYGDGRFGSNDPITRQDLAVTLLRYAKYKGYDVTAQADLSGYTDASEISGYAVEAMRWANAEALINGAGTLIAPKGDAQRAMVAAILMRFCENVAK